MDSPVRRGGSAQHVLICEAGDTITGYHMSDTCQRSIDLRIVSHCNTRLVIDHSRKLLSYSASRARSTTSSAVDTAVPILCFEPMVTYAGRAERV
jgi:hypothetical protein